MQECVHDRKSLQKYEQTEVTLDDDQNEEMSQIINVISTNSPEVLSEIFEEAESQGKVQSVRDIWQSDMRSQFNKDQARNGHYIMLNPLHSPLPFSLCISVCIV